MHMIENILFFDILNNNVYEYLLVLFYIFFGMFLVKYFKRLAVCHLSNFMPEELKKGLQKAEGSIVVLLYLGLLYFCLQLLNLPPKADRAMDVVAGITLGVLSIYVINGSLLVYLVKRFIPFDKLNSGVFSQQFFLTFSKVLIWIGGLLFIAENLGFKTGPLMAGLGIGGVAIALASQVLLKDLFSCFALYFDRPVSVGDFIAIGSDLTGDVEHIGIKTTRIRSLSGEEVILGNSDLTESRVRNYRRMERRRILFDIKVSYATSAEKLESMPNAIKEIVNDVEGVVFDRAHLAGFHDYGFLYEVVYYVLSRDYKVYMDVQQKINFAIIQYLKEQDIVFARLPLIKQDSLSVAN